MLQQPWRIEMLGGFCLTRGSERIHHFRTRKAAALLAFLALNPHQHSRDSLTDLFWPDADFEAARASFRVALSHLRRELGDDFLRSSRDTVTIDAAFTSDVAEFRQAVQAKRWTDAARLYRGELLPGFWDDCIVTERERLAALFENVRANGDDSRALPPVFLPPESNRFFGRGDEIETMGALLTENRLVTLLGSGGVGKTRLSLAAARRHAALFPGGVWFVPLADVGDPDRLLFALRDTLGLPRGGQASPHRQIADHLTGDSRCLLVLDNFEQIAAGGAPMVQSLLDTVPNLTCLVTSRRRLGIPGERQKTVAPLGDATGVALFCDRAQTLPGDETAALCRDLEGVPLAIELCAARAGVFTVAEMRAKLAEPFTLLWTARSDKSSRHRSLFAAIQWSFRLLTPDQQRFFTALSVFRGGWTREAAEAVCEEPGASEYLAQLRERSLLISEEKDGVLRFRLLETLRAFAEDRLTKGERRLLEKRHGVYFFSFAAERHAEIEGVDAGKALDRIEADHENLRAALERGDTDERLRLIREIWKFWEIRGHFAEGRQRIAAALAESSRIDDARAMALSALGALAYAQGDHESALPAQEEAVRIARDPSVAAKARNNRALTLLRLGRLAEAEQAFTDAHAHFAALGNRTAESATLNNLGIVRRRRGDFDGARTALHAAIALDRAAGNQQSLSFELNSLAVVEVQSGNPTRAEAYFTDSLAIKRELNDRAGVVSGLANLGMLAAEQGQFERALTLQREALLLRRELGLRHGILESLGGFVGLARATGAPGRAATLLGAQCALGEKIGTPVSTAEHAEGEAALRAALGDAAFAAAFAQGKGMTSEQAAAFALDV